MTVATAGRNGNVLGEVQVSSSGIACNAARTGAIRYVSGTGTQVCNSAAWANLAGGGGTVTGSGSATAVAYWNSSSGLTYDTDGFYWDATNNRLGLGTNSPSAPLEAAIGSGWARGYSFQNSADTILMQFGALGGDNTLTYGFIGADYAAPIMTFLPEGRVGIGTAGPSVPLHILGSTTNPALIVQSTSNTSGANAVVHALSTNGGYASMYSYNNGVAYMVVSASAGAYMGNQSFGSLGLLASNTEHVRITPAGNVGIGTLSPGQKLDVNGHIATSAASSYVFNYGGGTSGQVRSGIFMDGTNTFMSMFTAQAERMRIDASGKVGIGTTTPSATLSVLGEVQVSSTGLTCNTAATGAIRYTSGTGVQYCNSAAWTTLASGAGVTGTGSATSVAYWNGAGSLTYDTDGFYWDATNNRLGVGTNAPAFGLDLSGTLNISPTTTAHGGPMLKVMGNGDVLLNHTGAIFFDNLYSYSTGTYIGPRTQSTFTFDPGTLNFVTAGTQRMRIDTAGNTSVSGTFTVSRTGQTTTPSLVVASTGRVGMGVTSPNYHLEVKNSGILPAINILSDTTPRATLGFGLDAGTTTGWIMGQSNDNASKDFYLFDVSNNAFRLIVSPSGNVGISNTNPIAKLSVNGEVQISSTGLSCNAASTGSIRYVSGTGTQVCNSAAWANILGGGAGVSVMASLTDVQLSNLAGRDYLRYDFATSKWVNISESTVMSTTTMVPNWPDAIVCFDGSRYGAFHLQQVDSSTAEYHMPESSGAARLRLVYTASTGAYSANVGASSYDCVTGTKSISTLYAEGKAFNFIGSGASSSALGDRITSGTLAVTANSATSVVSLSTAGTTWGYLASNGSYLSNISSNYISASGISVSGVVQVSGSSLTCSSATKGAIRYSNTSSTIEYCNSTAWTSLGPSDTSVPSFSVHKNNSAQTVTAGVTTSLTWSTETFDTNNNLNTGTGRFTPTIAGKYLVTVNVRCATMNIYCQAHLYKNTTMTAMTQGNGTATYHGHAFFNLCNHRHERLNRLHRGCGDVGWNKH